MTIENNSFALFFPTPGEKGEREGGGGKTRGKVRKWIEWEEIRGGGRRRGGRGERGTWRRKKRDGEKEKDRREEEKQKIYI